MSLSARTALVIKNWLHDASAANELINQVNSGTSSAPAGGTTGQVLAKLSDADFDLGYVDAPTPVGPANTFAAFDGAGLLDDASGFAIDGTSGGLNQSTSVQPNGAGGYNINPTYVGIDPQQNSPAASYTVFAPQVEFDVNSSGFGQGTGGDAATMYAPYFSHQGTGDIGGFSFLRQSFEIGNGTDPINVKGMGYAFGFGSFHDGVTLTGPIQGYGFQPSATSGVVFTSSAYANAFYDAANMACAVNGWTSASFSPTLAEIKTNTNYNGVSINPTIDLFTGNASAYPIGVFGNYGTFGTGGFQGISVNPNVDMAAYANGIYVNMGNITVGGTKRAIDAVGDVAITGDLSFTGNLAIGRLQAFFDVGPVDGGGNPQSIHGLTSSITIPANSTTANADTIGVNTAMLMSIGANSTTTSGPFGLGLSALALPCVVETHTGSSVDYMSGATFALNFVGTATGGTVDEANIARSVLIPNGITTINKARGFYYSEPFGPVATKSHSFYGRDAAGYMEAGLLLGGTPLSDDVLATSAGLELRSTTKAILPSRMTTTERNALTPVNGMFLYNTTTDKLQVRAAGAWVDLH